MGSGQDRGTPPTRRVPDSGVSPDDSNLEDPPPQDFFEEVEPYRRRRGARLVTRVIATILVIALVLAFPLQYVLDEQLRSHHVEAVLAITEAVIIVVLVSVVWSVRRYPRPPR